MRRENMLDIILSTNDSLVSNVNTGPELCTSEHKIIFFNITSRFTKKTSVKDLSLYMYIAKITEKQGEFWEILIRT